MALVLDASVALTWALHDEHSARAEGLMAVCKAHGTLVPALFPTELVNALLMAERRSRISAEELTTFLRYLKTFRLRVVATSLNDAERILALARSESLTGYDAAYLHLALAMDVPLATFDEALIRAARRRGVPLA